MTSMNEPDTSSEPPEEPHLRSQPCVLSPASPKPVHFPQPTNIPILDMQMDVGFNQTEPHMSDPAMHNTELRPNAWQDPHALNGNNVSAQSTSESRVASSSGQVIGMTPTNGDVHERSAGSLPLHSGVSMQADTDGEAMNFPHTSKSQMPAAHSQSAGSTSADTLDNNQSESNPGGVDVQLLLDNLQTSLAPTSAANVAPAAESLTVTTTHSPSQAPPADAGLQAISPTSTTGLGLPPSGLPPRPPPQEQPLIHPNYLHSQHIRDYHPHAANPAFHPQARSNSTGNAIETVTGHVPSVHPSASQQQASGAGTSTQQSPLLSIENQASEQAVSGAAPPPAHSKKPPLESHRESKLAAGEVLTVEDRPWNANIQRKYDRFLENERNYVNEARWDHFPQGSRLFVGNLSSEKVTKRDIYHVFHHYGDLAQISIKQAYGFVQFVRTEDCVHALEGEQGRLIRDKRIHLEVSKPQKNGRPQDKGRRSRSPEHGGRGRHGNNGDRYTSGGGRGSNGRGRDGHKGGQRSPSPRGYRERHENRYRTRSRSPGYGRGDRYRGTSPRRVHEDNDDLPLPHRQARDVPDVQIIALDQLERDFIAWVEKAFSARGVRVDVLLLSPRLNEDAVVQRQIMEGVLAVSKLKRVNQDTGKIGLTIFKRRGSLKDVQFEEYDNLDPGICVELVLREKQDQTNAASAGTYASYSGQFQPAPVQQAPAYGYQPPQAASYGQPAGYGSGYDRSMAPYGSAPVAGISGATNLQNLVNAVDPSNLQSLLSSLNQAAPNMHTTAPSAGYAAIAAGRPPSGYMPQQYAAQPPPPQQQPLDPLAALRNNPMLAGILPQHPPQGLAIPGQQVGMNGPPQTPDMQDLLTKLGNYKPK